MGSRDGSWYSQFSQDGRDMASVALMTGQERNYTKIWDIERGDDVHMRIMIHMTLSPFQEPNFGNEAASPYPTKRFLCLLSYNMPYTHPRSFDDHARRSCCSPFGVSGMITMIDTAKLSNVMDLKSGNI